MNTLKYGARGTEVRELTEKLRAAGYIDKTVDVFGKDVRQAVKRFQASHTDSRDRPLDIDGIAGPLTWWSLNNLDVSNIKLPTSLTDQAKENGLIDASSLAEEALNVAIEEMTLGAMEIGSNNSGPWVEKYLHGIVDTPASWCAGFVSYCHHQASKKMSVKMPFRYSLGAKNVYSQFKKKGWIYEASDDNPPRPGDIIVWHRGNPKSWMGHIGLVHHYENGVVYTVEGNRGAFPCPVRMFSYTLGKIKKLYGFGRIPS